MDSNSERSECHENDLKNKYIKGVNMRSRTIVVSLPCDCLAAFEIVRISQQKWTFYDDTAAIRLHNFVWSRGL